MSQAVNDGSVYCVAGDINAVIADWRDKLNNSGFNCKLIDDADLPPVVYYNLH